MRAKEDLFGTEERCECVSALGRSEGSVRGAGESQLGVQASQAGGEDGPGRKRGYDCADAARWVRMCCWKTEGCWLASVLFSVENGLRASVEGYDLKSVQKAGNRLSRQWPSPAI